MSPAANLTQVLRDAREVAERILREGEAASFRSPLMKDAIDLATLTRVLDRELSAGGTLPDPWDRAQLPRFAGPRPR